MNDIVDNSVLELRRGVVVMAALTILRKEGYGYSVLRQLAENGLEVDQGTLYPLLRRLKSQGLLQSSLANRGRLAQDDIIKPVRRDKKYCKNSMKSGNRSPGLLKTLLYSSRNNLAEGKIK